MVTEANSGLILIVDDEPVIRRSLHKKLTYDGHNCNEAGSGEEALKSLREKGFDLVILDIKMPGKSGREILPEIHAMYHNLAIIMSTAITDSKIIVECMQQGASDYIIKPFNLDEVSLSVMRALRIRKLEIELKQYQTGLEQKVQDQTQQIRDLFLNAMISLINALEAKDKYTAGHSQRVNHIAMLIGKELNLDKEQLEDLRWGSLLHDVGKIAIDSAIQNKLGSLTDDEYRHIMMHVQIGPRIVKPLTNETTKQIISHHHDRYDGQGLNQTTIGKEIPLGARIVAIADAFDAMTSDRPYRKALSIEEALAEIKKCTCTQLDPTAVEAFLGIQHKIKCSGNFTEQDDLIIGSYAIQDNVYNNR